MSEVIVKNQNGGEGKYVLESNPKRNAVIVELSDLFGFIVSIEAKDESKIQELIIQANKILKLIHN